jgi:ectoine hydroxylase-related dioxygenase (phytanoyl-CoA dioxygenase family)
MKRYGITSSLQIENEIESHIENILIKGFSIKENVLTKEQCEKYKISLNEIYEKQENEFGKDKLEKIQELDTARMPFLYDRSLSDLYMNPFILELTSKILGNNFQLHLQNAIINKPNREHHQTSWHRDLPYQDWIISKPLAFNAFFCLTDFTEENGSTVVLPFSHKIDYFPSERYVKENEVKVIAKAGSVIFFDSMLYHRASYNASDMVRYGVNNIFVVPIIKQQVDIANCFSSEVNLSEQEKMILGIKFEVPSSVIDFREKRYKRIKNEK